MIDNNNKNKNATSYSLKKLSSLDLCINLDNKGSKSKISMVCHIFLN